jgi:hypothetical protein
MDLNGSWEYIEDIARSRLAHNKTKHHISDYGEGIEVIGVAGEIAARRFLGLPEEVHSGFDGGCDLIYAGKRVDVKTTVFTPNVIYRFLQWPEWKRVKSDIILMTVVDPISKIAEVIGYATESEIKAATMNRERPNPCFEIAFTKLHPAYELVAATLRRVPVYGRA